MATVSVFVDDAVRGTLPPVCVRTGEPADLHVQVRATVGGLGAAWLLVLLGPIGLVALVALSVLGTGREQLAVLLPESEAAVRRERRLWAARLALAGLALASLAAAGWHVGALPLAWVAVFALAVGPALVVQWLISTEAVVVRLDASRRWVTLAGVHPSFARALDEREAVRPAPLRGA